MRRFSSIPDGRLTEGSRTNIFVERDGKLLTPPASRGLIPGILRAKLIDEGKAEEAELTVDDLDGRLFDRQYCSRPDPGVIGAFIGWYCRLSKS